MRESGWRIFRWESGVADLQVILVRMCLCVLWFCECVYVWMDACLYALYLCTCVYELYKVSMYNYVYKAITNYKIMPTLLIARPATSRSKSSATKVTQRCQHYLPYSAATILYKHVQVRTSSTQQSTSRQLSTTHLISSTIRWTVHLGWMTLLQKTCRNDYVSAQIV